MKKEFSYPRDFKGVFIPKEVYLDDDLSALEMIILSEIYSLDVDGSEGCYASNEYLANFCKCGVTKISNAVTKLKNMGYISSVKTDGRTRWIKVDLQGKKNRNTKKSSESCKKCKSDMQEMKQSNIDKDNIDNNIKDNIVNSFSKEKGHNSPDGVHSLSPEEDAEKKNKPVRKTKNPIDRKTPMPIRAGRIAYEMYGEKTRAQNTANFVQYFLEQRKRKMGTEHIILSDTSLEKIVYAVNESAEMYYDDNVEFYALCRTLITDDEGEDDYKQIVDAYFEQKFTIKVDYSLSHFIQDNVIARVMLKTDKDYWCCLESI